MTKPEHEALLKDAVAHHQAGRLAEAEALYRQALVLDPEHADANHLLGVIALQTGAFEAAVDLIGKSVGINPDFAEAHCNLGVALMKLDRAGEATESYRRAIEINPDYAEAHFNLGKALNDTSRAGEALESYRRAIDIQPDYAEAHHNLGNVLRDLNHPNKAAESYRRAIDIRPDYAEAHHNLAFALLGMGDRKGLEEYDWRWKVPTCSSSPPPFQKPLWNGTDELTGRTILLWPEQGPQDVSTWASGIPEIVDRAGHCIVEVFPKLVPLFARSFPGAEVRADSESLKRPPADDFDIHLPLGSLFRHLEQDLSSKADAFLVPDPERITFWQQRLEALGPGPYAGISWKSPMLTPERAPNYTRIEEWAPLFTQPARFINLQCGGDRQDLIPAGERFGGNVHDFDDLDLYDGLDDVAALTAALDVVISVSTAVAAIAAGTGTPVWLIAWRQSPWNNFLLAPRGPDVIRYERNTDEPWDAVFAGMADRLRDLVNK